MKKTIIKTEIEKKLMELVYKRSKECNFQKRILMQDIIADAIILLHKEEILKNDDKKVSVAGL